MQTTKYTFWKLINEYKIEIPIIQRDYAQGRNVDNIPEIRKEFLENIYNALVNEKYILDFDFVYGSVDDREGIKVLLPLDGQQRLTTLFLLHWYLATKENKINDIKNILSRFTYETRISSRDFCHSLVEKGVKFDSSKENVKISDLIKDAYWFYMSWIKDPTVKAMLTMLDDIHLNFKDAEGCFEKLIRNIDSNPLVTFRFLELENFGLNDNLYIKMNARGKALTDFENFKAKFNQIVGDLLPEKLFDFSTKIDNSWADVFWKYNEDNAIDNPFMRYIYFITEMLYVESQDILPTTNPFLYNENNTPEVNYELIKSVYSRKENIEFLIASLDFWIKISMEPDEFINSIFSEKYMKDKVVIFDGKSNLWKRCLSGDSFGIAEKILLYSMIKRCIYLNQYSYSVDLVEYLRVIRNLLIRVRQTINTRYTSNLRFDFMKRQLKDITELLIQNKNVYKILTEKGFNMPGFSKDSVESEIKKAILIEKNIGIKEKIHKLEDNLLFKGCIDNILEIIEEFPEIDLDSVITEIWSNESSIITKALLSIGDYSVIIGYSQLGPRKYFGGDGEWNIILTRTTSESQRIKEILKKFIKEYINIKGVTSKEKLEIMVNNYLNNAKRDWRYYFIKYSGFVNNNKNLYAWLNEFELRKLNGNSLLAYHINPYVKVVALKIADSNICNINDCYGIYGDLSPLRLKNNVILDCLKEGWKVRFPENYISKNNNKEFNLINLIDSSKNEYWLKETDDKDRVEMAIDFIKLMN
ncbi:hypothetical protein Q428_09465 [Fervidicella metallireducens AeB]|uniref:GmrSD restriction endonucleases N-terminal domain-containing protein n=1 Tax=Fervidicella metallireducens AeB TaxID=1403537 RepID=A0A017RTT9_9CLOT|nr:DUF262 domain-containing protein [Fervidicella metallireducens]EYE88173.1 hypothetical protein Q428_09465 [Fervidicella metallireducens AeB]